MQLPNKKDRSCLSGHTLISHEFLLECSRYSHETDTMPSMNRIRSLRKEPVHIKIQGRETLALDISNIIHEAGTTSLQIHLQVNFSEAKDFYNASLIASPIMCALCANSPFIYGKELWDESRIPLFEQVISLEVIQNSKKVSRVGLGHGFVNECISELFDHNLLHPILLPEIRDKDTKKLHHLLLHNGTIWRWNRPLIGFDERGNVHFRIEHRVPSAGPVLWICRQIFCFLSV